MRKILSHKLPSDEEFFSIVNEQDPLKLAIRGHKLLNACAGLLISELLAEPHDLEITRLSFLLKVDLLVALSALPRTERLLGISINRIRNRFAHDEIATLPEPEMAELQSSMSPLQRDMLATIKDETKTVRDLFGSAIAVLYFQLEIAILRNRDAKLEGEILHQMVKERIARWLPAHSARGSSPAEQELRRRVAERKKLANDSKENSA